MSLRWFLLFSTTIVCVTRVVYNVSVPTTLSSGQGVMGDSNPRPTNVTLFNTTRKEPPKTIGSIMITKQQETQIGNESEIGNVKQTVGANVTRNHIENIEIHNSNHTDSFYSSIKKMRERLSLDNGAVKRTFYVVAGLTGIVLLYFVIKGITMKRKPRIPRYGLLAEREMDGFDDGDDEDEDTTLFDAARYKKKSRGP